MNPDRVTSLSLLDRARHHDEPSWRRLITLYGPLVEHWCRRGGARPGDTADLAQEVFLAVSQGLERFERRGPGSFRGWVRGITRHKLLDEAPLHRSHVLLLSEAPRRWRGGRG